MVVHFPYVVQLGLLVINHYHRTPAPFPNVSVPLPFPCSFRFFPGLILYNNTIVIAYCFLDEGIKQITVVGCWAHRFQLPDMMGRLCCR